MVTFKVFPDFPKYALTSNGRIMQNFGHGWKKSVVRKDEDGFRFVILFDGDIEKKVFLLALKFPRGEGYKRVLRLKKKEEGKLKRLKQKARKLGRHHKSLKELHISLQKYERRVTVADPE